MEPEKIGRYEIKAEIGRGGMATVYRAQDPRSEREVAIKVLPREMLHDPQFRTRFEREAKTIAMLEHPAIVPVYDFGEEDGQPYFVMRYMTGGSLSDRLDKGPLSLQEAARLFARMAPALDSAHAKGIIHRDLKPGNILFDQYGEPYISDFGIAKLSEAQTSVTGSAIVGTPAYMAPEQAQGKDVDGRADIYGLGVILFEMLTGQQPYHGDTPMSLVLKHVTEPVPHILDVDPNLPPAVESVVEKALAKDREERFATCQEMADALRLVSRGENPDLTTTAALTRVASSKGRTAKQQVLDAKTVLAKRKQAEGRQPPQRKRTGLWVGLGAASLLVCAAAVAGAIVFRDQIPFLAVPTQKKAAAQEPSPSTTSELVALPVVTDTPEAAPTKPRPAGIGGADLVAFLNGNDIWTMRVDGSGLERLTSDGAAKHNLQWAPDGQSLYYISGKCIQNVSLAGEISSLTCFIVADFLEAFEISPDGSQVAISLNRELYVVPFDLEALAGARNWTHLRNMEGCFTYGPETPSGTAAKRVRWSNDSQKIAVEITAVAAGKQVIMIRVLDITTCDSAAPRVLDGFPASRFNMIGYNDNPIIPFFDWDGETLFLLNSAFRFQNGYLYSYNLESLRSQMLDPLGACCYGSLRWSPDGTHVFFAFQDINLGASARTQLFYVPYGTIGTGTSYKPFDLPPELFTNPRDNPDPVLRPVK